MYDSFNVNTYHLVRTDNTPDVMNSLDVSSYVTVPSYSRFFYDLNFITEDTNLEWLFFP